MRSKIPFCVEHKSLALRVLNHKNHEYTTIRSYYANHARLTCVRRLLRRLDRTGGLREPKPVGADFNAGVTQDIYWDFTQCTFGIQNFTISVTQPRNKSGYEAPLQAGTHIHVETTNLTTRVSAYWPNFICYMGTVSSSHVLCSVTLSAKARRPADVEVSYTAAFGGNP